ncbi:MAG: hypothetical protein IPH81_07150 [Candidatus Microthrix sp.]|nr:hypothetical protein [Candidatus Microthrix sp.]MBK7165051.1 hypothetical protein [Candidatus Microthrix sp.]
METATRSDIGAADFYADPHAAKYQGELEAHPDAFQNLFELLNLPANEQRLTDAEMHNLPALAGVVRFIEADPAIERILISGPPGFRFRQSVGVAVKLKMAKLGWRSTGRKGAVKGASHFTKAERFAPGPAAGDDYAAGALAAIDAVGQIGEDSERQSTGRALMDALAATRRSEGRPF